MIGVRCMSFFVLFSNVVARTRLKVGGCEELGPTRIFEVIGTVFMIEVPCKSFFFCRSFRSRRIWSNSVGG